MITFTIPGKPFAKQRPRFSRRSGRAFTPKETVSFESVVRSYALEHFPEPLTGPVRVQVFATFQPPKSWSKKKTTAHLGRYHTQKPDADNIIKAILDGLNRVAFVDDSQAAEQVVKKIWGPEPQTVVQIIQLEQSQAPL